LSRVIAPPPHCDECGFDAREPGPAIPRELRAAIQAYRPVLTSDGAGVRRRPDEKTWSPLEYGAHVRDVVAIWNWVLKQALNAERPTFPVPDPDTADQAAADGNYAALDPAEVAAELEANADRMVARLSTVDGDGWTRVVLFGDEEVAVLDIANKVLHEAHHHLQDIDRQGVQ
jgi:hypothetical protein